MIVSPTTPLLHARRRALVAATLALGAMILGLGAAPAVASESQTSNVVAVSSALASNPGLSTTVTATIGDSLAKANEVLGAIRPMTLVGFNPGNIISDAVFYNSNSMTEAQIQAFLNSKVPKCQSGFVCLRDYKLTTTVRAASPLCAAYVPAANEPAARIIFRVAQACGINPQVILVTLQKEQGLVAHTSPSDSRYRIAMGQGCPDTAACDTAYYGFFNQVYGAAAQLKRYSNPPGTSNYFTWFAPGKTWNVQFHPDKACGSAPVRIENQATANLYYYTPYQPNPAALAAGYGDPNHPCASFGNRNFYNYFTDWFGPTQVGAPELASINTSPHVLALDGGGTLWAYPTSTVGLWGTRVNVGQATGMTRVLSLGDVDGDGHRDVVGVDGAGAGWLMRGNGARAYGAATKLGVDWSQAVLFAAAGDFDGDGFPDIFTTDAAGTLWLWSGTFVGGFKPPRVVGAGWDTITLIAGGIDFDGNGATDLVARKADGTLALYIGDGRGGWNGNIQIGVGWNVMDAIFIADDMTGDGLPDLLARNAAGELVLYPGTGAGRIVVRGVVGTAWQGMVSLAGSGPKLSGARVAQPGAGDLDGDGALDVVAMSTNGQLSLYPTNGRGGWLGTRTLDVTMAPGSRIVTLGDFTGDGKPDLARITADGRFVLLPGTATGALGAPVVIGQGWNEMDMIVGGMDFDGDRRTDILARTRGGELRLYRGNGAGGWLGTPTVIGVGWQVMTALVYAGDFDGDQKPDLIARRSDGALMLYPTDGRGSWRASRQIGTGWNGMTSIVVPGNFDGAGGVDVLARATDGRLHLYRTDGKANWGAISVVGWQWQGFTQIG